MNDSQRIRNKSSEKRLITAALPYINNVPHLGHITGSHLPADIFARYCRARGYETLFVGGTDENGSTSEIVAEQIGIDINVFIDKMHLEHKKIYDWFNISYDNFSRTSRPIHHQTTQDFFKNIYDNGYITRGKMKVFYSPRENRFLPDRYIKGTCPKCGYEDASSDQCEKCTSLLDPNQLINPKSAISGGSIEIREAEHLFLGLDKLSEDLEKWLEEKKNWRTQVTSLALGWIREGLKERCITRDLRHGVKVPLEGFEDKVFYVWFDAPIGYISATKEKYPETWKDFWKDKNSKIYHFLGKDNIPFHTIFWPAMLIAHGEFNLPYQVVGLQYLNYEGKKFSKSKKIGVFCEKLPETGIDPDVMRAYLIFTIPEIGDSEFKWKDFQNKINSEIIGNYGNFINRTLSFIYNKLDNMIERPSESELTDPDKELIEKTKEKVRKIEDYIEKIQLKNAFSEILSLSREGNRYFNDSEPWNLMKRNVKRTKQKLYLCANLCRTLAVTTSPYLPNTSKRIWDQLNLDGRVDEPGIWDTVAEITLSETHRINRPYILFNKIKDEDIESLEKKLSEVGDTNEFFRS